jgi:hypothetical protein
LRNTKKTAQGHWEQKVWNAETQPSAPPWQCASTYSCSHSSTAWVFQLGVVWPPSLQSRSRAKWLPPVYPPKELVVITALQRYEELMQGAKTWLSSQAADFFDTGIQKLIPRYKCLNSGGGYAEK